MVASGRQRQRRTHEDEPGGRSTGIGSFLDRYAPEYRLYGTGKVALRDAVAAMLPETAADSHPSHSLDRRQSARSEPVDRTTQSTWNVLLPAYVPDAVAEPLRELGVEPRYYAITPELKPDEADLAARTDEGTLAIVSIDYFGFPQPGVDLVVAHAAEHDCYHVDDNAHGALSVADGKLLGTLGDVGITSLWKTLTVPNGAVLYVTNERLRERIDPSTCAGVADTVTMDDVSFVCARGLDRVLGAVPDLRRVVDPIVDRVSGDVPGPAARYEAGKRPCSKLTAAVCARVDPASIRMRRRAHYRAWLDELHQIDGLTPLFETLPVGICPQCVPVEAARPAVVQSQLATAGLDVHTWPRLPADVVADPTYETAQTLGASVLALPVDQAVDTDRIASLGATLRSVNDRRC
ncbi:DegT/DnrJ/EryC1/StrS aminotransferase [Halovivax asiaticus JCM 14624]|uniref:DegT/DnrJ/EryC1/StrS aminotransferase n=1 Tax=Halovivax asiaticus JCM 14624 TaxID=1227490 RepID=M0BTI0_9EURY|nr:DegT/DnrJ/EryC1/StrS family aminotransferase [Halovivax asiaticus]ELZ14341.1 DegT/DnrJ/EryC1/StrS aminotransferase [Halovivax asiaticus JCM 14624]